MKRLFIFLTLFTSLSILTAQTTITYNGSGNYILIEKTDLRRYDNGKYTGLVSREISSYISPVSYENGYIYEGNFYVWQNTQRNAVSLTGEMQDTILSKFKIDSEGKFIMLLDYGYPSFRSFPSFPDKQIQIGDKWQAKAERAVDPLNNGKITKMPIYVEYQYLKDDIFHDEECYVISANWATRYGIGNGSYNRDWGGDKDLDSATGKHRATIYVSKDTGNALLIRDTVDETFKYTDGNQISFKGSISQFTEYPPAVNHSKLVNALKQIANITPEMEAELNQDKTNKGPKGNSAKKENENNGNESESDKSGKNIEKNKEDSKNTDDVEKNKTGNKSEKTNLNSSDKNSEQLAMNELDNSSNEDEKLNKKNQDQKSNKPLITKDQFKNQNQNTNNQTKQDLVTVENTEIGIKLTINDLQFQPDSAELLAGEKSRLDQIANVLSQVPENQFLIEGHTASTGNERGEMNLSLERAHAIARELIKRGIDSKRIICKGSGGKKPVADNSTPQGKARNRRVEITILE